MKIGVVGSGVFGCVIGAALAAAENYVTIFDCGKKQAGSKASGFLMKPSWFSNMKSKDSDKALALLDKLYGLQEIKFKVGPLKTTAFRVDGNKVLQDERMRFLERKAVSVADKEIHFDNGQVGEFDLVVVAAGVWCTKFFGVEGLEGKVGVSHEWEGQVEKSFIKPWAPYKQVVVFNIPGTNRVWGGDGSAIISKNWTEEREMKCLARVSTAAKLNWQDAKSTVGIRPFYKTSEPCLLEKRGKRIWLATGGAKNGTIAAAWAANRLLGEL